LPAYLTSALPTIGTPFFTYAPNSDLVGQPHTYIQSNDVTKGA
jgi:hypothetical protein